MNGALQIINELLDFIHVSPTAYQAAAVLIRMLKESGFKELKEEDSWNLKPGEGYYLQRNSSTVAAFRVGLKMPAETGFLMAGAHTDSPSLKLKYPVKAAAASSVEIYGNPILSTWLDRVKARSFFISADGAHAVHPNFPGKHDSKFAPELNKGPVLKMNAGYSYATNSESTFVFDNLCRRAGVQYQRFIGRSDIPSGSTIGSISSSQLGIRTVDIGNPMLAMHSIRETAGVDDHSAMIRILSEYYRDGIG